MKHEFLTIELLEKFHACDEGIVFAIRNKLIGFPFSRLDEVRGDYLNYFEWFKKRYTEIKFKQYDYNENGKLIHFKNHKNGYEYWKEYDENGNLIYLEDSSGYEEWYEYDKKGNITKLKNSNGFEIWKEYDEVENLVHQRDSRNFEKWMEYDEHRNRIHSKDSKGFEMWWEYDDHGNEIFNHNSSGYSKKTLTEFYPNGQLKRIDDLHIPLF